MTVQVLTPQNFTEFVQTGKVPEFKPPEPAKAEEAKPSEPAKETSEKEHHSATQPRENGKFTNKSESDKNASAAGATPAEADEGGDDLPEHVRKVIGKKHRLMKEAEEFGKAQYLERIAAEKRAEQLEQELQAFKQKSRPAPEAPKEPKPDDFATVAEYTDALVSYRVEQKLAAEQDKREREAAEREQAERAREFGKRIAAAREKHDDFDDVLKSIAGTDLDRVHKDVTEYIQESELGPDLLYHLAKNPDVLDRLRKLSPRRFIAELGKLEAKWEAPAPAKDTPSLSDIATTTSTPAVSKAPAPIAALTSDKATVVHKDPSQMSFQELREYERQRQRERRARA